MMKRLLPFVLLAGAMSPFACAAPPALPLDDRQALIETLLERMTQEILDLVMAHPAVCYAEVEVDKPHALRFAESVSITLAAHRD